MFTNQRHPSRSPQSRAPCRGLLLAATELVEALGTRRYAPARTSLGIHTQRPERCRLLYSEDPGRQIDMQISIISTDDLGTFLCS